MKAVISFFLLMIVGICLGQVNYSEKELEKKKKKFLKAKNYVYIPSETFYPPLRDSDVPFSTGETAKPVKIDSFYMGQFEISNREYLLYLDYLQITQPELLADALPDTMVWRSRHAYQEPYVDYYLRHPAYRDYPVVGVSFEQAKAYAKRATEAYNNTPDRIFDEVLIRLPTEMEWQYAASGGEQYAILPWSGTSVFDEEGEIKANFGYVSQIDILRDSLWEEDDTKDQLIKKEILLAGGQSYFGVDLLAAVQSYSPNKFGLYNMAGNVEEMVTQGCYQTDMWYNYFEPCDSAVTDSSGITKGGSWRDPGAYMRTNSRQFYRGTDYSSTEMGFRVVLQVIRY
ncbi:MAG: SUMF1/EgtB/PvdO family nonheme iron enzyme [Crocinitomicaceae bacterium]